MAGKRYAAAAQAIDRERLYEPVEAIELLKEIKPESFDSTVELHIRLGVDPRHADQQVRGVTVLPHGTGKEVRIIVFAEGEGARLAKEAGADEVGSDELIEKVSGGWLEFDVAIAVPQLMGKVGRLGKVLGPRGLMPNPKAGTVVQPDELERVITESRQGRVEFRIDKGANLHMAIGKSSFETPQLLDNLLTVVDTVQRAKPAGAKGQYIKKMVLSTTMSPGIKLDVPAVLSQPLP